MLLDSFCLMVNRQNIEVMMILLNRNKSSFASTSLKVLTSETSGDLVSGRGVDNLRGFKQPQYSNK